MSTSYPPHPPTRYRLTCVRFDTLTLPRAVQGLLSSLIPYLPIATWMAFATQRLSVASQLSMAQEAAEALGLSVAADPRAQ